MNIGQHPIQQAEGNSTARKERFFKRQRERKRDTIRKECVILDKFALLWGTGKCLSVNFLVPTRKFQVNGFKITFAGWGRGGGKGRGRKLQLD